jgi:hypothetical protein
VDLKKKLREVAKALSSGNGVVALLFLSFFLGTLSLGILHVLEWTSIVPILSSLLMGFALSLVNALGIYYQIHYKRPVVRIIDIAYHRLEASIRIYVVVGNEGRAMANYVKPLITIEDEYLNHLVYAENRQGRWDKCWKNGRECCICSKENKKFLCPPTFEVGALHPRWRVEKEPLCWTIPEVRAGQGLQQMPYCHVTNIAPRDSQKIVIADVYRSERERACVVKIADEYGIDYKPRICYRIDLEKGATIRFKLELVGENFEPIGADGELKIAHDELRVRVGDGERTIPGFKELKEFPKPEPRYSLPGMGF